MRNISFSGQVKEHLRAVPIKKKCCRRAFSDGEGLLSTHGDLTDSFRGAVRGTVCDECAAHLLGGLFCAFGNITDPSKGYHLEFSLPDEELATALFGFICDLGFTPSQGSRKGRALVYFKNSTSIEDILGFMGAAFGAFDVMNAKIMKEMRGDTNRQVNCDSANIAKTLGAAERLIEMIETIRDMGLFNSLTGDLKETAEMRLLYPEATLGELGLKFTPPISKSGIKHRLDKIADFYNTNVDKKNKE